LLPNLRKMRERQAESTGFCCFRAWLGRKREHN
jgi:hypothetical protein